MRLRTANHHRRRRAWAEFRRRSLRHRLLVFFDEAATIDMRMVELIELSRGSFYDMTGIGDVLHQTATED